MTNQHPRLEILDTDGNVAPAQPRAEDSANAPELAKALTDLLDAFRECVGHAAFDEFDASNPAVIAARAALAKAAL